jgi:hypothetical protein
MKHLATSSAVEFGMPDRDLRWRLKMIAAQVDPLEGDVDEWIDASYDAWSNLYDEEAKDPDGGVAQVFIREDPSAPHYPILIHHDPQVRGFGFAERAKRPRWDAVRSAFGDFVVAATERMRLRTGLRDGTV